MKVSEYKKEFEEEGFVVIPNFLKDEELSLAVGNVLPDWYMSTAPASIEKVNGPEHWKNTVWTKFRGGDESWGEMNKELERVYDIKRKWPEAYTFGFMRTSNIHLITPFKDLLCVEFEQISSIVSTPITEFFSCFLSSYHRGCYLNDHTDQFAREKNIPKVAFILNLTKNWHPTMGGLLFILNEDQSIAKVVVPTYNSLVLMKLPRRHFVSEVAQPVLGTRQAFAGWLR